VTIIPPDNVGANAAPTRAVAGASAKYRSIVCNGCSDACVDAKFDCVDELR
jgi:hypothetical protein